MKKAMWKKAGCLLALMLMLCVCSPGMAERTLEATVGVPFQVDMMLNEAVSAQEVEVVFAFAPYDGNFDYKISVNSITPAGNYSFYVYQDNIYLQSASGFSAGKLCTVSFTISAWNSDTFGVLPYAVLANGQEAGGEMLLVQVNKSSGASTVRAGDKITFGAYEQDNNKGNGPEAIEWRVLAVEGNKALVISDKVLDQKYYHPKQTAVTWETCWLREWLNNDFLNAAFTSYERGKIVLSRVPGHVSPYYDTESSLKSVGNDTWDYVFLLSAQEANQYFSSNADRIAYPTRYLVAKDPEADSTSEPFDWLMRQPHKHRTNTACVSDKGATSNGVNVSHDRSGLRPVMWLNLQ
ncbi:MAG: hypothetical protein IJB69_00900 [Clostridia bacterium]|nr:hypothetical protein [Clostridia bacterium]